MSRNLAIGAVEPRVMGQALGLSAQATDVVCEFVLVPGGTFVMGSPEDEEGRFYVWTLDEVRSVCGSDAEAVMEHFGVTRAGNFEGANILAATWGFSGSSSRIRSPTKA